MILIRGVAKSLHNNRCDITTNMLCPLGRRWLCVVSNRATKVMKMATQEGELRVFMVAGEVSGDTIASRLMSSLKKLSPLPLRFSGVGGSMMSKEGLKCLFPMEDIAVMGIWELLPYLNKFRVRLRETVEAAILFRPHVVVTVDSKGFSFRFLKKLRARHIQQRLTSPVHFHYVAPSFWAWKGGEVRLSGLVDFVDHIFCILPNEELVCKSHGLPATFVGHPILEDVFELSNGTSHGEGKIQGNHEEFRNKYAIPLGAMLISLLPGSRLQEVTRMLPIFQSAVEELKEMFPSLMTIIHVAPNVHVENYINKDISRWSVPAILIPGGQPNLKYDAFSASNVALCTSGTVAMELQLARLPCVVAYRAHVLTELFIQYKAMIPYISLPNILLDSPIIPEVLFRDCTPTNLTSLLRQLINEKELQDKQILAAEKVIKLLFPWERSLNSFACQNLDRNYPVCTPSMVAASVILSHVKPELDNKVVKKH